MIRVFIDTDVLIDYLRGKDRALLNLFRLQAKRKVKLFTSTTTVFETFLGRSIENKGVENQVGKLFKRVSVKGITEEIAKFAAEIARKNKIYGKIELADLFITASAIYFKAALFTKNKKHFKLVPDLKLFKL